MSPIGPCRRITSVLRRGITDAGGSPRTARRGGGNIKMFNGDASPYTPHRVLDTRNEEQLMAMWAQFATTFRFSLRSVMTKPIRAALFGAAGGPVAFLVGDRLGAVILLPPLVPGLLRLSISWALALVVFSTVVRRITPEPDRPHYRALR